MSSRGLRVLIVERDVRWRALMASTLRSRGHHVETMGNPLAALACYEELAPDVAIVELAPPEADGRVLVYGALPRDRPCRFIAVAAAPPGTGPPRSGAAFEMCLTKPVRLEDLISAIEGLAAAP